MSLTKEFGAGPIAPCDLDRAGIDLERSALVAALGRVPAEDRAVLVGVIRRIGEIQAAQGEAAAAATLEQVRTVLAAGRTD